MGADFINSDLSLAAKNESRIKDVIRASLDHVYDDGVALVFALPNDALNDGCANASQYQ